MANLPLSTGILNPGIFLPKTQLSLRFLAVVGSLVALIIAIDAHVKIQRTWGMVFVSTLWALSCNIPDILYHLVNNPSKHPRFHFSILITLDLIAVGIMILTFFQLAYDGYGIEDDLVEGGVVVGVPNARVNGTVGVAASEAATASTGAYNGEPWRSRCLWVICGVGCTHFVLLVFDIVDACLRKRNDRERYRTAMSQFRWNRDTVVELR